MQSAPGSRRLIGTSSPIRPARIAPPMHNTSAHMAIVKKARILEGRSTVETAMDMEWESCGGGYRRPPLSEWQAAFENQILPKTSVPFVPPKPNEFFTAILIGISRAVLAQ